MIPRVVLDTNVVVSALLKPGLAGEAVPRPYIRAGQHSRGRACPARPGYSPFLLSHSHNATPTSGTSATAQKIQSKCC
jgi:hypothetical protein